MEFFEAPAFTRYVSGYLTDEEYGSCRAAWRAHRRRAI
jgi:hypothetical protein